MTVYKSAPMSRVYHWKVGEGPHRDDHYWDWHRNRRDARRAEHGESWSECGRRLPDDLTPAYLHEEEVEVGIEQRCKGSGCYDRWRRYQRSRTRDGRTRALEAEARERDMAMLAGGNAGGAAVGRAEGVPGVPGQGAPGGVAGGEGGGLPGPQDAGAVQGDMAPNSVDVNGVNARLAELGNAVRTMGNAFTITNGHFVNIGTTTVTMSPINPPPPPPCACGNKSDTYWEHSPEECTWREVTV